MPYPKHTIAILQTVSSLTHEYAYSIDKTSEE